MLFNLVYLSTIFCPRLYYYMTYAFNSCSLEINSDNGLKQGHLQSCP